MNMSVFRTSFLPVVPAISWKGQTGIRHRGRRWRPRACMVEQHVTPMQVKQVSLRRPMGIVFEETETNVVFVSEVLPDSNAEKSGRVGAAVCKKLSA